MIVIRIKIINISVCIHYAIHRHMLMRRVYCITTSYIVMMASINMRGTRNIFIVLMMITIMAISITRPSTYDTSRMIYVDAAGLLCNQHVVLFVVLLYYHNYHTCYCYENY